MSEEKQVEKRTEYRAVYDENDTTWRSGGPVADKARAERRRDLEARRRPGGKNFRVQKSIVTETRTPWEDVDDE